MALVMLSPEMVRLLNVLRPDGAATRREKKDALGQALVFQEGLASWLAVQSGLNDEESAEIASLQSAASELRDVLKALESGDVTDAAFRLIAATLYGQAAALERFRALRSGCREIPIPLVREFLAAAAGFLRSGRPLEPLFHLMPLLAAYVEELHEEYLLDRELLRNEAAAELDKGMGFLRDGAGRAQALLTEHGSSLCCAIAAGVLEELSLACQLLKGGASILGFYLDWRAERMRRDDEHYCRFSIPLAGAELEIALEHARSSPGDWEHVRRIARGLLEEKVLLFWQKHRAGIIVRAGAADELRERIDGELSAMSALLASERSSADELEVALERLSGAFDALGRAVLVPHGDDEMHRKAVTVVRGILSGAVPDFALSECIEEMKASGGAPPAVEQAWREYLDGGGTQPLLAGLEALLDAPSREADEGAVLCLFCGASNPSHHRACSACGARMLFRDTVVVPRARMSIVEGDLSRPGDAMMLPDAAGPLLAFLTSWTGELDGAAAGAAIDDYFRSIDETRASVWRDQARIGERAAEMLEKLERFEELGREALASLESHDREALREALVRIAHTAQEGS